MIQERKSVKEEILKDIRDRKSKEREAMVRLKVEISKKLHEDIFHAFHF